VENTQATSPFKGAFGLAFASQKPKANQRPVPAQQLPPSGKNHSPSGPAFTGFDWKKLAKITRSAKRLSTNFQLSHS
jgi:hypothetical protein